MRARSRDLRSEPHARRHGRKRRFIRLSTGSSQRGPHRTIRDPRAGSPRDAAPVRIAALLLVLGIAAPVFLRATLARRAP